MQNCCWVSRFFYQFLKIKILDGKPIKCGDSLKPGVYDNLELAFCLPELEDILQSQGLSRESFKSLVQSEVNKEL